MMYVHFNIELYHEIIDFNVKFRRRYHTCSPFTVFFVVMIRHVLPFGSITKDHIKKALEKLFLALLIYNGVNQPAIETVNSERGEFFAQFNFINDSNALQDNMHIAYNSKLLVILILFFFNFNLFIIYSSK